jgi:hypothetical protein
MAHIRFPTPDMLAYQSLLFLVLRSVAAAKPVDMWGRSMSDFELVNTSEPTSLLDLVGSRTVWEALS